MNTKMLEKMLDLYEDPTGANKKELNSLLLKNPLERAEFITHIMDEEIFRDEFRLEYVEKAFSSDNEENSLSVNKRFSWLRSALSIAAVIAVLVAVGAVLQQYYKPVEDDSMASDAVDLEANSWCAKLADHSPDAEWGGSLVIGDLMSPGRYELRHGSSAIEFSNGVQLTVESPATFEIKSVEKVVLHRGKIRANVPEAGHGFLVDTPDVKIRDLGTEFGVDVGGRDQTQVHVFNGEVEFYQDHDDEPFLAEEGYAAIWVNGQKIEEFDADENYFLTAQSIGFQQWKDYSDIMLNDPSLLAYYDFSSSDSELINRVSDNYHGTINEPIRVRGRWLNKAALLFDSSSNWVKVPLPNLNGDFTFQTWVSIDHFDQSIQTILNTKQNHGDLLHWQLDRSGEVHLGVKPRARFEILERNMTVGTGDWVQLSVTYHSSDNIIRCYINATCVKETTHELGELVLGECMLGAWQQNGKMVRGLRGRMDEFSLRQRCLSDQEIAESFKAGMPN